jgi:hypothetical protein
MELLPLVSLWLGGVAVGAAAGYIFYIIKTDLREEDDDDDDLNDSDSFDYYFDNRDTHK